MRAPRDRDAVRIWFSGDDADDRAFAERIAEAVADFARPVLTDVDELERQDDAGVQRQEGMAGTPVFVLSPAMTAPESNRRKLLGATPLVGVPGRMAFYICRGVPWANLLRRYPELGPLFDTVMVGEESDLPQLLSELREYQVHKHDQSQSPLALLTGFLLSTMTVVVANILWPVYWVTFLVAPYLIFVLVLGPPTEPRHGDWAAWLALYGAGFSLNRLPALDFWPYLGRRWRFSLPSLQELREAASRHGSGNECFNWVTGAPSQSMLEGSNASITEVLTATRHWSGVLRRVRYLRGILLMVWLIPAVAWLIDRPTISWGWGGVFAFAGAVFPAVFHWGSDNIRRFAFQTLGLDRGEMAGHEQRFGHDGKLLGGIVELEGASSPASRARLRAEGRLLGQTMFSWGVRRLCWKRTPCVFISHVWADDTAMPVTEKLKRTCDSLGVRCFLDRERIRSKFAGWRSQVATGLLDATHVFLVIGHGNDFVKGGVTPREINLCLQRWDTEILPTVICVVQQEEALKLVCSSDVAEEVRFVLQHRPNISLEEAADADTVALILRRCSRQGLLRDWLTALFPVSNLYRMMQ